MPNPEPALRRRPWVEDLGVVLCYLPRSPFIKLTVQLAGISNIVDLWLDARDEFKGTLAVGDASIHEVRAMAGPRPILWEGVPGIYFTPLVTDQEFERHVREVLEVMVRDKRIVLGVADQVPPDGLRSRVARVAELVERHGQYR